MKKYDLMNQINARGTYLVSKCALPYLKASKKNPQILNISPPLNMKPRWFRDHCAYTMAKYGMSMCVLGMSEEFKPFGIGVNALWPQTGKVVFLVKISPKLTPLFLAIITAAMEMLGGGKDVAKQCRLPDIMSDAAYVMLTRDGRNFTGNFSIDEAILREEGMTNFDQYAAVPGTKYEDFIPDFFLDAFDDFNEAQKNVVEAQAAPDGSVQSVFDKMSKLINDEMVGKMKAVYAFDISGT